MIQDFFDFIKNNPSVYHTVDSFKKMAIKAGYTYMDEKDGIDFSDECRYVVTRNDSSIAMVDIPMETDDIKGIHIFAAHCDSPAFKLKENPELPKEDHYVTLNTEKYGGMIMSTWMDRPLSIAGRVVTEGIGGVTSELVNIDRDLLVIPSLAIHMDRDVNKGHAFNAQKDMLPLFSEDAEDTIASLLPENTLSSDLFCYIREEGRTVGANGEYIVAPRLDDMMCAYGGVTAMLESEASEYINICVIFNNEEVGSTTMMGADSTFLWDILDTIKEGLNASASDLRKWIANGLLISADNAHAVHPNFPDKADPTNRPYPNGGIVIKYHANAKYTTDAATAAAVKLICNRARVPYQSYTNRSDIVGGSTLGNISASHVSIPSADIGLAQLAMHSAVETAGERDLEYLVRMVKEFF